MLNATLAANLAAESDLRRRLFTEFVPFPLVEASGIPMLHNAQHQLCQPGIYEATVVVGTREEAIDHSCGQLPDDVDIEYVHNPSFDRNRSFLRVARNTIPSRDAVFLERHVFFERGPLDRTRRTISATEHSVAGVAAFNASLSSSASELVDHGSAAMVVMNQLPAVVHARGLFEKIDLIRFHTEPLREELVPTLHRRRILAMLVAPRELQFSAADGSDICWGSIAKMIWRWRWRLSHCRWAAEVPRQPLR
ncbi:hypothetical protein GGD67_002946 [Bradyrhizobium sp. IAR9]|uniref:phosphocholine cytidylyltransferase family protein n=1 Tax=Bradyrhizobium sp. IAR9 TaxID=2663841 RepID=UPI0015CE9156|nr:phosphocholine cytidylyltransferase family protein [Bradyrhizobium sp. IAR9]NYG45488.1 hypothetical protein [Bradyrhizobium sp. IAR9]